MDAEPGVLGGVEDDAADLFVGERAAVEDEADVVRGPLLASVADEVRAQQLRFPAAPALADVTRRGQLVGSGSQVTAFS
ncbi:hypothetical protein K7B10_11375 [Streptomyces flavotricini]|uniref:Uncharacterized protein n=1 Tax=Streptomyces flavotricini TaxID=66888 RepID=A0ABS8E2S7_9ACTN|nr:hypothetical protein [Streptomyces flavotricini]MCC0095373.1 hypothetical protein [Streptomyces flavotricini]